MDIDHLLPWVHPHGDALCIVIGVEEAGMEARYVGGDLGGDVRRAAP